MCKMKGVKIVKSKYNTYYLHFTNPAGIRRRISVGSDESFAYRRANQFEAFLLDSKDPERELQRIRQEEKARQITLKEFFPEYLRRHSPHLSEKTQENYKCRFRMISKCKKMLDCPLANITKRMVLDYMNDRIERDGVSNATANRESVFLKGVLSRAVEWDLIKYNQLSRLRLLPEASKREVNLSRDQAKALLETLPANVDQIVEFALVTGIRKENCLSLKISQLKLHEGDSDRLGPVGEIELLAKGDKRLRLPLSSQAVVVLRRAIGDRIEGYVFLNPKSRDRYYDIFDTFSKAVDKVGLKVNGGRFVFHDLRHAFATHLHAQGVGLDVIRQLLGHEDLSTTDQYTTYDFSRTAQALEDLPKLR
jgi:integrase